MERLAVWIPSILGVTLALPGFSFGWLWDDYDFAGRILAFRPSFLAPDSTSLFYRPISRELYFSATWLAGGGSPFAGHLANALLLAVATFLLTSIAVRLAGSYAGVIAGIAFASLGAAPLLVAWVSGAQDLLAIVFGLTAARFALEARPIPAACALGAAVLSKETAFALLPILAAMPWIVARRPSQPLKWLAPFVTLATAWVAIHPGLRSLWNPGTAEHQGYVGLGSAGRIHFFVSTVLSILNLPPQGVPTRPLEGTIVVGIAAMVLAVGAIALARRDRSPGETSNLAIPASRVRILGALLLVLPLFLTTALVRDWIPYYAAFPALGSSILVGSWLWRAPRRLGAILLLVFLGAGLWTRGMAPAPGVTCERNLSVTSRALQGVESGFKSLYPQLPGHTQLLVSVGSTGAQGVQAHLHRFQALRVWYHDPTIVTVPPERRPPGLRRRYVNCAGSSRR